MFKVVPDQLRVSDGWVRCGQCAEVFDANLNLQDGDTPDAAATDSLPEKSHFAPPPPESADLPEADEGLGDAPFLAVSAHALHFEPEALSEQFIEPHLDATDLEAPGALQQAAIEDDSLVASNEHEHSFLPPKGASIWMMRSVRVILAFLCVVLCLLLVAQVVLQERDRIAATAPTTRPFFDAMCRAVGCAVAPFRQIESVVIDSSSFTKVRSDVYRLGFSFKNTAQISIATPALELTLTDMQDQPVIRRVFMVTEFGDSAAVMEAGAELLVSVPISVKVAGNSEKIAGYRLLSFYP
jgi:predicted Zn finger-like uncharacterized protein